MRYKVMILLVLSLIFLPFFSSAEELTGRQIMDKQKELHETDNEFEAQKMILVDSADNKEVRDVKRFSKEVEEGVNRFLIVFLSPENIKGTALLTWEHKDAEDDQWLYMPAREKMQRIAKGGKKNYFMGTDFAYEDLRAEDLDAHEYNRLKDETIDGQDCYVVEALPSTDDEIKSSGYNKRVMWIKKENFVTVKVDYYDKRDSLLKTQVNTEFSNVEGTLWRPSKTLVDNIKNKHKTLTGSVSRDIKTVIDDAVFTERFILSGQHTK